MQYNNHTYTFEDEIMEELVKRYHYIDGVHIDFSPYQSMTQDILQLIINHKLFDRFDGMNKPWDSESVKNFHRDTYIVD